MGLDLLQRKRGRKKVSCRRHPRTRNIYINLLHQLYSFLARRTNSNFNSVVAKRLAMSRNNRAPITIARLARAANVRPNDIIVVVGTVTDDCRLLKLPKISVCALHITERARKRILRNGGEIITFDSLALRSPLGKKTYLLRGATKARKCYRYFNGAPRVRSKGRKFEKGKFHGIVRRNKRKLKTN